MHSQQLLSQLSCFLAAVLSQPTWSTWSTWSTWHTVPGWRVHDVLMSCSPSFMSCLNRSSATAACARSLSNSTEAPSANFRASLVPCTNLTFILQKHSETLHFIALNCISLHWIAFHCISLHWIAFHCIELHFIALNCISLRWIALNCISLHWIALNCISLHFIEFHCISLHWIAFHCIELHFIAFLNLFRTVLKDTVKRNCSGESTAKMNSLWTITMFWIEYGRNRGCHKLDRHVGFKSAKELQLGLLFFKLPASPISWHAAAKKNDTPWHAWNPFEFRLQLQPPSRDVSLRHPGMLASQ